MIPHVSEPAPELPAPPKNKSVLVLTPKKVHRVTLACNYLANPTRKIWNGNYLKNSPFESMILPAVMLKCDDYGLPIDAVSKDFFDWLVDRGNVAGIGIVTRLTEQSPESVPDYQYYENKGFELWFHGHTHRLGTSGAEFREASLEEQTASFAAGMNVFMKYFDKPYTTFGAPGNAINDVTSSAIQKFPNIKVWLYGQLSSPIFRFHHFAKFEEEVGKIYNETDLQIQIIEAIKFGPDVGIVLQMHPTHWDTDDLSRAKAMFQYIENNIDFRYTTPMKQFAWIHDREQIRVFQIDEKTFDIDMTYADYQQEIISDCEAISVEQK